MLVHQHHYYGAEDRAAGVHEIDSEVSVDLLITYKHGGVEGGLLSAS
jgi:hypothetical protein